MSSLLLNYNENIEKNENNSNRLEFTDLINGSRKIAKKTSFNNFNDTYNKYINENANIELPKVQKNNFFNEDTKRRSNSSNGNMNNFNKSNNHHKQDKNDESKSTESKGAQPPKKPPNRDGRTFLVLTCDDSAYLNFGKYDGVEDDPEGPAHERLSRDRQAAADSDEILAGGGCIKEDGAVKCMWKSGTCQLGVAINSTGQRLHRQIH